MKFLKRFLIFFFVTLFFIIGTGIVILEIKKDELSGLLIEKLNKEILTPIKVREIDFSLLKSFPNITAVFKEVVVFSSQGHEPQSAKIKRDTLFYVKRLNISIQPLKILRKQWVLHRFYCEDGFLHLKKEAPGENYFTILKNSQKQEGSGYSIKPENLIFKNLSFTYEDISSGLYFRTFMDETKFIKKSSRKDIRIKSSLQVNEIRNKKKRLLHESLPLKVNLLLTRVGEKYKFGKSIINIAGFNTQLRGTFGKNVKENYHLEIKAQNQPVENILKFFFVNTGNSFIQKVDVSGKISLKGQINKSPILKSQPGITVDFSIDHGQFKDPKNNVSFSNFACNGIYNNGKGNPPSTGEVFLKSFSLEMDRETLTGNMQLLNLEHPDFNLGLNGNIRLKFLRTYLPDSILEDLSGTARVNLKLSGSIDHLSNLKKESFKNLEHTGHVELINCRFKLKDSPIVFSAISGSIMAQENMWMDNVSLKAGGQKLRLSGEVLNLFPFLTGNNNVLEIRGSLFAPNFNLTPLLHEDSLSENQGKLRKLNFPKRLITHFNFTANQFSYHKFKANRINGLIHYNRGSLLVDSLTFQTMNGEVSGNLMAFQKPNDSILVQVYSELNHIDIHQLFNDLNNFSQSFITQKNLEGTVTGTAQFYSMWGADLKISNQSILAESHINIKKGRLVDFEPIQSLSRYIALKELKDIRFSDLENEIYINDQTVTIPQMDIHSSAFDLGVSGIHYFNNHYTYNIRVLLSQVLASKAKKTKKENHEFGTIEDDGLGKTSLYFKITGNGAQVDVAYDTKQWSKKIKEGFIQQGKELKEVFRTEFGGSKKDSAGIPEPKKKPFSIIWDENKTIPTDTVNRKKKKFKLSWEEESADTIPALSLIL